MDFYMKQLFKLIFCLVFFQIYFLAIFVVLLLQRLDDQLDFQYWSNTDIHIKLVFTFCAMHGCMALFLGIYLLVLMVLKFLKYRTVLVPVYLDAVETTRTANLQNEQNLLIEQNLQALRGNELSPNVAQAERSRQNSEGSTSSSSIIVLTPDSSIIALSSSPFLEETTGYLLSRNLPLRSFSQSENLNESLSRTGDDGENF